MYKVPSAVPFPPWQKSWRFHPSSPLFPSDRWATTSQKPHSDQHSGLQVGLQASEDILKVVSSVLRWAGSRLLSLPYEGPTTAQSRAGTCPAPHRRLGAGHGMEPGPCHLSNRRFGGTLCVIIRAPSSFWQEESSSSLPSLRYRSQGVQERGDHITVQPEDATPSHPVLSAASEKRLDGTLKPRLKAHSGRTQ